MNHLSYSNGYNDINPNIILPSHLKNGINQPIPEIRYYPIGYLRLSCDDGKYKMQSASIETQRDIVLDYASRAGITLSGFYVDDGWSGTNFDRPDWKRLMGDIESGKTNMIVFKDLSRMSRNAAEASIFIKHCKEKGVRLIAVSDGIDTLVSDNDDIIEIINMYNGWYPRDVSKKTRNAKQSKASQGKFLGSNAPFGYAGVIIGTSPRKPLITGVSPT